MEIKMLKIFLIVSVCIFALTHHLQKISASASDLSSSSATSLPSLSLSSSASASSSSAATATVPQSSAVDAAEKTVSIGYEENKMPAKEISITASSSSSQSMPLSTFSPAGKSVEKNLATRRQKRSLFYPYGGGLYSNLYIGYGTSSPYYYPSTYSYAYYPTFYKYWGVYNPYYGYPRVISG